MSLRALETALELRHGLRVDEIGRARLLRALDEAALRAGTTRSLEAQAALDDPEAEQQLLDRLTLQESSFFRDAPLWEDLATHVLPAALQAAAGAPLTVWSAGCANGQEAWGLAMVLEELGARDFTVVASDLSAAAMKRTAGGRYAERELRGLDAQRRRRFTVPCPGGREVVPGLRRHVQVVRQNVALDAPPVVDAGCALVLCRYVLIYLTRPAAAALLEQAARVLRADGVLVIGAAESLWHLTDRFTAEPLPRALAYRPRPLHHRRAPAGLGVPRAVSAGAAGEAGRGAARRGEQSPQAGASAASPAATDRGDPEAPSAGPRDVTGLEDAGEAAAARGDLPAAAAAFRAASELDPDDALAAVRLGLVLEAMGDPDARHAFGWAREALDRRPADAQAEGLKGYEPGTLTRLLAVKLGAAG